MSSCQDSRLALFSRVGFWSQYDGCVPQLTVTVSKDRLAKVDTFKTTIRNLVAGVSQDDVEGTLMDWWQDLLDLEAVGLNEDFLELGGNSLIGLQLFSKIKNRYGISRISFSAQTGALISDPFSVTGHG
jgi:hypothetical protein